MYKLIKASLLINIAVLIPISTALVVNTNWVYEGYGADSPARNILLSIYFSILLASVVLLFLKDAKYTASLLILQIVYKLTTPFTVGTLGNPVVVSNLFIAVFHIITVYSIWKSGKLQGQ